MIGLENMLNIIATEAAEGDGIPDLICAQTPSRLDRVSRETIIRNAHQHIRRKYRKAPLWAFVRDICGVGATSATEICRELGWDPNKDGAVLPDR